MALDVNNKAVVIITMFAWLWLVAGADLLWEKSTGGWLMTGGWC